MIVFDESMYLKSSVPDTVLRLVFKIAGPIAKDKLLYEDDEHARTNRMDFSKLGEAAKGFLLRHSRAYSPRQSGSDALKRTRPTPSRGKD